MQSGEVKICRKCGRELPSTTEYFYKSKQNKDGLMGKCKTCAIEYQKIYYEENADGIKEHTKKRYKENAERERERKKKYQRENADKVKQYYRKNITMFKEYQKEYREKNADKIKRIIRKWHKENPAKNTYYQQIRKSIKKALPATLTAEQWLQIKDDFDNRCAYCGKKKKLTQDHFIPLSKGGEYTHNNIMPVCKSCNSSKQDKDFFEWYPEYKYFSKERENKVIEYLNYKNGYQQLTII
jgi:5-methylcytosine-specific restriction endonuclease McrA